MTQNIPFPSLNTPAVLLDLNQLETNIEAIQRAANEAGVKLRPHIKIHSCAEIAKMQIKAGACGIEVGPVEEAEAMAEGGLDDIVVAHPFYGEHKLEILKRLLQKPENKITLVADMIEQAKGYSKVGRAVGRKVPVLLKIDTGVDRYGVLPGEPTLNLAKKLKQLPFIELIGIYTHESGANYSKGIDVAAFEVASIACEMAKMLRGEGIELDVVSVGSSPTYYESCRLFKDGKFTEINEIHPGGRVIGDIVYMMMTEAAAKAQDLGRLQLLAPKLEELATRDDHMAFLAVAHRAQGIAHRLAGEPVEAVARLNQAMDIFTELETGWQIGRTYFEMGEVALSMSDVGRAQGYFNQALASFEAMKAMPDIERTQAALGALN